MSSDQVASRSRPSRRRLANAIRMLVDGRRGSRALGSSRHADGHGRHCRSSVERLPAFRADRAALARPRPVRAVERPRLDAAVLDRLPDRLRNRKSTSSRSSASSARAIAGHPERDLDLGIETTTGPLGQGLANAVGMALAERTLAATFNRPDAKIVDHYTYVFLGDGCLMEGISHEACSFAGTQKLGKLIAFYDDNGISIDGETRGWFTDDTPKRFEAYGWHVVPNVDGHDAEAVRARDRGGARGGRSPVADLLQDDHRLRRAERAGHVGDARRRARRGRSRGRAQESRLGPAAVRDSRRRQKRLGCARARQEARGGVAEALRGLLAASIRTSRRNSRGA